MTMKETKEERVAKFFPQISVILSVRLLTYATEENSIAKSTKDATLFGGILFKINCRSLQEVYLFHHKAQACSESSWNSSRP